MLINLLVAVANDHIASERIRSSLDNDRFRQVVNYSIHNEI